MDSEKLEANIWKIYLFEVLYSLMFFTPIVVLFLQNNGLSLTEIMLIQSINSALWIITEIPSGYFADVVGRKESLLMTGFFSALSMFVFAIGHNFWHFLIASLLWALAGVFISGADSALVYDTLKDLKKEHSYKKIWGNVLFYYAIGTAIASVVGGFLGQLNFRYPFLAMLPFYLLLIPLAISFHEPKRHKAVSKKNQIQKLFSAFREIFFHSKKMRWLLLYSAILISAIDIAYYLYQPYFKLSGLDVVYFGIVFASFNIIQALSSKYAHWIENKIGQNFSLIMLFILTSACYILMGKIIFIFGFVFAFLFQFVKGFSSVVISDYIHKVVNSNIRATTLSVKSFIEKTFYAVLFPIIGWLVNAYTLPQTLIITGIVILIAGGIILIPLQRNRIIQ